jgi:hypothetical protein
MVVSDSLNLGYLGKSRKSQLVVPANTNFNFPAPVAQTGAPGAPGGGPGDSMGPSVAPTFMESYLPWIIGGGIVLVGVVGLVILKKTGNL